MRNINSLAFRNHRCLGRSLLFALLLIAVLSGIPPVPFHAQVPLSIAPSSGFPGSTVTIAGWGFKSEVDIYIDTIFWVRSPSPDANGGFSLSVAVPKLSPGVKKVTAEGASTTFTVLALPVITTSPSSGLPGIMVNITGSNFKPASTVNITIEGKAWTSAVVARDGSFSVSAAIPQLAPGEKKVAADSVSTSFIVLEPSPPAPLPAISVTPTSGTPGSNFTVIGSGFPSSAPVTVTMEGTVIVRNVMTTGSGTFTAFAVVPQMTAGEKRVVAVSGRTSASALFAVRQANMPDLVVSSTGYRFEDNLRILVVSVEIINKGNAISPDTLVEIREEGNAQPVGSSQARSLSPGAAQSVEVRLKIPPNELGITHTMRVTVDPRGLITELNEENNWQVFAVALPASSGGFDWYWIVVIVIGIAGLSYGVRRLVKRPGEVRLQVRVSSTTNKAGAQQIETESPVLGDLEIRLRLVRDTGIQYIEADRDLPVSERREADG